MAGGVVTLRVRVKPRSSRDALAGEREGVLVVRLTAPPVEGAANQALVRVLSAALGVARSSIQVLSGAASRQKRVAVSGVSLEEVRARLEAQPAAEP